MIEIEFENPESSVCDCCGGTTTRLIGRKLSREEALEHPWLKDVFHITDYMTDDDPEIKAFFADEMVN